MLCCAALAGQGLWPGSACGRGVARQIHMDFKLRTVSFDIKGAPQGVAFSNLQGVAAQQL